ncbi:MAG: threonine/serine exporter family protein [Opitutaceae bacterium]|nr:threonine/serine exporter family protein [Opitutaceae bacterium]
MLSAVVKQVTLDEPGQREVTRLCVQAALTLLQHGAESALVESVARRLGVALGVESVEVAIMANAVTVTTLSGGQCVTTVRRNEDRGINMHVVTEVQRTMLDLEDGRLDRAGVAERLGAIRHFRHPRWLVALGIGLSCACFAALQKGDLRTCAVVFVASMLAMVVRQLFAPLHFNPLVTFFAAAFVATSVAAAAVLLELGATAKIAMASSVLLLVPGFPLINGVSDMVKGYINTGISRLVFALMLATATCGGILLGMAVWNTWGWS